MENSVIGRFLGGWSPVTCSVHQGPLCGKLSELADRFSAVQCKTFTMNSMSQYESLKKWMFPKIVGFPPKSSILIRFFIIKFIHFGVPLFLVTSKCCCCCFGILINRSSPHFFGRKIRSFFFSMVFHLLLGVWRQGRDGIPSTSWIWNSEIWAVCDDFCGKKLCCLAAWDPAEVPDLSPPPSGGCLTS